MAHFKLRQPSPTVDEEYTFLVTRCEWGNVSMLDEEMDELMLNINFKEIEEKWSAALEFDFNAGDGTNRPFKIPAEMVLDLQFETLELDAPLSIKMKLNDDGIRRMENKRFFKRCAKTFGENASLSDIPFVFYVDPGNFTHRGKKIGWDKLHGYFGDIRFGFQAHAEDQEEQGKWCCTPRLYEEWKVEEFRRRHKTRFD